MDDELASFRPHLLVHNDPREGIVPIREEALREIPHRMEVLYSDGMDARLSSYGRVTELGNACTEDLLGTVDAAFELAGGAEGSG